MDLLCLSLATDMTDSEIKECVQEMIPVCTVKGQGFCLTISGYDDDHRELWQIPEAIGFMKRLCDLGFISALEVSTTCTDLLREEYKIDKLPGFGALEVWMCATNRMGKGKNDIDRATMTKFQEDLGVANRRAEEVVKEPSYRTGLKKSGYRTQIPDASIKHHGFNKDRGPRCKPR
jgi:hypothetical protein